MIVRSYRLAIASGCTFPRLYVSNGRIGCRGDGRRDPRPQGVGHRVLASPGDQDLQLGLEVERLEARGALVEMSLDVLAFGGRQLPVEEVVQGIESFLALGSAGGVLGAVLVVFVHGSARFAGDGSSRPFGVPSACPQEAVRALSGHPDHATPSAAAFFHGAAGT